jgi:hypothetical protein
MDGVETCAWFSTSILDLGVIVGAEVIFGYKPTPIVLVGTAVSVVTTAVAVLKRNAVMKRRSKVSRMERAMVTTTLSSAPE